jgi:hypothetical protein
VAGRLRRCEARERAHAGIVADLPAVCVQQRFGEDPLIAEAWPWARRGRPPRRGTTTLNLSVRDALALERDAAAVVSRPMVTAATAISGNWDTT